MTADRLDELRANVARHEGVAQTRPLMELGQELANTYWRIGPGSPAATPVLDEAIGVLDEAYGYLNAGDAMRGQVAAMLGWLSGVRHTAHGGSERDRETGIFLLDEALGYPHLPPIPQTVARVILGQLLIGRVTAGMNGASFAMTPVAVPGGHADLDRSVTCFQQVLDGPVISEEITAVARAMLTVAEAVRTVTDVFRAGPAGVDLGRIAEALAAMQNLQQTLRRPGTGFGSVPNFLDADAIAAAAPAGRPVAVIDGTVSSGPSPAPVHRPAVPSPSASAATLRTGLWKKLGEYASITALVTGDAPMPDIGAIDDIVALGGALTSGPDATGADHLLLAVGLYLRSTIDSGGWGGADSTDDVRAAGKSLLAAADALHSEPADALVTAFHLATRLDERWAAGQVREQLSTRFTSVTRALRMFGADALIYPNVQLTASSGKFAYADATASGRPSRVLMAGTGPLSDGQTGSYVRSAAQLLTLAARTRRAVTETAVFVTNPRLDREHATVDALRLRRTFYPRSVGLGHIVENVDGAGTPAEVRSRLTASMLHLGCGITESGDLELAGSGVLSPAEIAAVSSGAPGGVTLLPPSATGVAALTEALLAAGHMSVIGFRDPVPDSVASLMYFLLHAELVDEARDPASAVATVRRWLADPGRRVPEHLPADLRPAADAREIADPAHLQALTCWGL